MKLLLDTHVFVWWISESDALPGRYLEMISDRSNTIYVSPASAYEITLKHRTGKWPDALAVISDVASEIRAEGFLELPISARHMQIAAELPLVHRDPFDRMIAAQAIAEDLAILTSDSKIKSHFPVTIAS